MNQSDRIDTGFPTNIGEITSGWLTDNLSAAGGADSRVTGFSVERIGEGVGLMGELHRLRLEWEGATSSAPRTVIAKLRTDNPDALNVVKTFNFYEKEVRFYNELAPRTMTRTPMCYAGSHSAHNESFVLLLEDVSNGTMGDQVLGATQPQVEATVEELVKLHASWWNSSALDEAPWLSKSTDPIYTIGIPQALDAYHPITSQNFAIPSWYDRYRSTLVANINGLADAMPLTLCHGDMRLDNLFFDVGNDPLVVIDWQIVIQSVGIFDVGYFMSQSVPIGLRRTLDHDVVTHYRDRLIELDIDAPSFEQLWDGYRQSIAFCLCYPIIGGATIDPAHERSRDLIQAFFDRCVTAAEDLDAVSLLG